MFSDEVVLCGASAYTKKFYFNEDFEALPQTVKDEPPPRRMIFSTMRSAVC